MYAFWNFYPRPPRGGRHPEALWVILGVEISIHALREEGDLVQHSQDFSNIAISIHALREEGDLDFYYPVFANLGISIHALREEGDSNRN